MRRQRLCLLKRNMGSQEMRSMLFLKKLTTKPIKERLLFSSKFKREARALSRDLQVIFISRSLRTSIRNLNLPKMD